MATKISDIDLYVALRDKLGDTETRDLIEYVKTTRQEAKDEIKIERGTLASKDDIGRFAAEIKQELNNLRSDTKLDVANLRADMEKGFKEQLRWVIVLLLGFSSLIITVIKLL